MDDLAKEKNTSGGSEPVAASNDVETSEPFEAADETGRISYRRRRDTGREPRIVWPGFGMAMLWLCAGFVALGGAVWYS
jgi:hypothetical protein